MTNLELSDLDLATSVHDKALATKNYKTASAALYYLKKAKEGKELTKSERNYLMLHRVGSPLTMANKYGDNGRAFRRSKVSA